MSHSYLKPQKRNCNSPLKNGYSSNYVKHQTVSSEVILSKSISTILKKNRENTISEFLIILTDNNYKPNYFQSKSYYDKLKLKEHLFPGILNLINIKDLKSNKEFIIKDQIIPLTVYIKLPRENIYVSSDKYYEAYFQSQMNELIRIFTTLKAETIDIYIEQDRNTTSVINVNGGIHYNPVDLDTQYSKVKTENNKTITIKNMLFKNNGKDIDINDFIIKRKFYYLPNEDEWQDIIRNRIKKSMIKDDYCYVYENSSIISKELIAQLKIFNIGFRYNVNNNKNITIKYNVKYFPLDKQKLMDSPSVCMSPNKKRNSINLDDYEYEEMNNNTNGFLYRLFKGILF